VGRCHDPLKENITFQNEDVLLKGTLTQPDTTGPYPVVIVAHTSAAGTRDFGVYQHLVSVLSTCGVAVFLFDRRGSGESTGEFETATFFDLAADIQAAIDYLKLRRDIDPKHIGLWGMSQGGWIAPLTASESADVAFVIAVSAAGVSPAEQMNYSAAYELRENGFSDETIEQMLELRGLVNEYCRGNANRSEVQEKLDVVCNEEWFSLAYLNHYLPEDPTVAKWYQELDFDPIPIIQNIDVPILLLYAERDPWIPIAKSIARWEAYGPRDATIRQIKDANHFMISITHAGIRGDKGPQVEEYSTILTQWVKQQLD
jgi:pimeloyl-ACP methyl ester carboxylesterase